MTRITKYINLFLFLYLCIHSSLLFAQVAAPSDTDQIKMAKKYINENKGKEALNIIQPLLRKNVTFDVLILTAQSYAEINDPRQSLQYYEFALTIAKDDEQKHVAYFGIAKMQSWLGMYENAVKTYQLLLKEHLNLEDTKLAQDGLNKNEASLYKQQINLSKQYINHNKGKQALTILNQFLGHKASYEVFILSAQSYAELNNPKQSLYYYKAALASTKNSGEQRAAYFGIAKMQKWLGHNVQAAATYSLLLKEKLSKLDYQLASDELMKIRADQRIALIKKYINEDQGKKALAILKPMLCTNPTFNIVVLVAQSYAISNDPYHGLLYYQAAYRISKDANERRTALFGIAKMQFWLSFYVRAAETYGLLLCDQLNQEDYQIALAGYVKSLAYYDRPRRALGIIPCGLVFKKPELVIAAAQASLWSDWADITNCILSSYRPILRKITSSSPLYKDLMDVQWQTDLATWPNVITPSEFYSIDSESFIKKQSTLTYTRYWNQISQSSVGLDYIVYTQSGSNKLIARGLHVVETIRPTRYLIVKGIVLPMAYDDWHLVLGSLSFIFQPNDYINVSLLAAKEVVETFSAFNDRITDNQYALSTKLSPFPYFKFDGSIYRLKFVDTNIRNGYYLSASYQG